MTAAEKRHLSRVAELGCALCRMLGMPADVPVQLHHIREGQGMAQRASNFLVVPVCPDCHQGPRGIHGDRGRLRQAKVDEMDLLADTIGRLAR